MASKGKRARTKISSILSTGMNWQHSCSDKKAAFLASDDLTATYGDIRRISKKFLFLNRRLVLCLLNNNIYGLTGYIGILQAGAAVQLMSSDSNSQSIQEIISSYRPSYLWLPSFMKEQLDESNIIHEIGNYSLIKINQNYIDLNSELMLLLGTSGSTGSPKFVRLSKENVLSNAKSIAKYLELDQNDLPITTLPPSYTYGLSIIHSHLLVGASIAVTDKTFFDREFWDFFRRGQVTSLAGVPYHYEMLKKLRFTEMELPSLRKLTQAGGRMEPELTREFATFARDRGIEYFTMYGQAEATARMSYLPPERAITKAGSIGVAIPGGRFWLEDENGQVIQEEDVAGELVYSGPNVSMGYASSYEDLAKGDERGGILRTGDLAKRDPDWDYCIVGRLKRFIKLFGHRTNLLDIEKFLLSEGYITACSGQDDLLEIYVLNHEEAEGKKIKQMVCNHLKVALQGVVVYAISEFPRNDSGKIQYGELKPALGAKIA